MDIKSFCLMCKRTGNLFEGWRVNLVDAKHFDNETPSPPGWKIYLTADDQCDGWLIGNPLPEAGLGEFKIFMNAKWVAKWFENLGEI